MPDAFEDIKTHIDAVEAEAADRAAAAEEVRLKNDRAFDEAAVGADRWLSPILEDFVSAFGLRGRVKQRRTSDDAIVTHQWQWVAEDELSRTGTRHPHSVEVLMWRRRPSVLKVRISWSIGEQTIGKCAATREAVTALLRAMFADPEEFRDEATDHTF